MVIKIKYHEFDWNSNIKFLDLLHYSLREPKSSQLNQPGEST